MIHRLFTADTILHMSDWTDLKSNSLCALFPFLCAFVWMCVCVHVYSKDLSGALEAVMEFQKRYNHLPRIHDIIVALVEKGDTELLQKGYTSYSIHHPSVRPQQ